MENNCVMSRPKNIVIGGFVISCFQRDPYIHIELPYSAMAFYTPQIQKSDFCLEIGRVERQRDRRLLFGSEDYIVPTFLYQETSGYYDWITKQNHKTARLCFRISPEWNQFTLYEDQTNTNGERAFHVFGSLFSYAVLNHHACVLHGVVMEYMGKGILVVAAAGTGKTTHTRMWRDYKNTLILNGDRCLCRKTDEGWYAYGMPWFGSSGEYINRKVPISCIVNLNRGTENIVYPLSVFDGTLRLMQRVFAPVWSGKMQNHAFDYCEELASELPVLDFYCRPDLESVEVLERAIMQYGK